MKTVFVDVDTQLDFLYPAGALYVPGAEEIVPVLRALTRFAAAKRVQILSTADAHAEDDVEFNTWKPHCVAGTLGQHKDHSTVLPRPMVLNERTDIAAPQIIVEKQMLDAFSNPRLAPLLSAIRADCYVLYGVVTELCVRCAAIGLLETAARVELVTDAIRSLSAQHERVFLDEFQGLGGRLTTSATILN